MVAIEDYPLIKIEDNTKSVPVDCPIERLRFRLKRRSYYHNKDYGRITENGVENLRKEHDVVYVKDLEGWSEDDLMEVTGIGQTSARRLVRAAELADVEYRGEGWPWEAEITIRIPQKFVKDMMQLDAETLEDAAQKRLSDDEFFSQVAELAVERRIEELEQQREQLGQRILELRGEDALAGLRDDESYAIP
jgi:autonomous glycyl radical cofactor GrcA